MKVYDVVVSLGQNCATAYALNNCGLRSHTYCFDWLRSSLEVPAYEDLKMKTELICSDFSDFFNIDDLIEKDIEPMTPTPYHCVYNKRTHFEHWHDFFSTGTILEQYEHIKNHYDKRINRLYKNIEKASNVLFVYISQRDKIPDNELIEISEKLNIKFPSTEIDLMFFEHDEKYPVDKITKQKINKNIIKYILNSAHPVRSETPHHVLLGNTSLYYPELRKIASKEIINQKEAWARFLFEHNEKEYLKNIKSKLKNKKIILYGAGILCDIIIESYDLAGLDIVAVCNLRFDDEIISDYKGYKAISPNELKTVEFDTFLISVVRYDSIKAHLKNSVFDKEFVHITDYDKNKELIQKQLSRLRQG